MSTVTATWKNPATLRKHLGAWAARSDTQPDPKAWQAGEDALAGIDAIIAELGALRARVLREMGYAGLRAAAAEPEAAPGPETAAGVPDWAGNHRDTEARLRAAGHDADTIADILQDAAAAAGTGIGHDTGTLLITAEMAGGLPWYTVTGRGAAPAPAPAPGEDPAEEEDDDRPVGYLACGDQLVVDEPSLPGAPTDCPRHGATRFVSLAAWLYAARPDVSSPVREDQDDRDGWADEEIAALPPMFPPLSVVKVGPWPYARAA